METRPTSCGYVAFHSRRLLTCFETPNFCHGVFLAFLVPSPPAELLHRLLIKSVHPHGRGENLSARRCHRFQVRFTPTGVGKIHLPSPAPVPVTVPPHGRGENSRRPPIPHPPTGSPPRAWGKCPQIAPLCAIARFTPTGVGKMRSGGMRHRPVSVHPHGRGENAPAASPIPMCVGSPPRAWGK